MEWPILESSPYLETHEPGDVRVRGTRLDLCVLVEDFLDGRSPEQMILDYPTLDLEAAYGAIAYYLGHREAVDRYVALCRERSERMYQEYAQAPESPLLRKLRALKSRAKAA